MLGPIITGGMQLLGQGIQNQRNKQLAEYQNERNLELWKLQNAYNTPFNQIQRLKAAGLNPALMYGTGSGANTAGPATPTQRPDYSLNLGETVQTGMQTLGQYTQIKNTTAQTDNVTADTTNKQLDAILKGYEKTLLEKRAQDLGIKIDTQEFDLQMKKALSQYNVGQASLNLSKLMEEITNLKKAGTGQDIQNQIARTIARYEEQNQIAGLEQTKAQTQSTTQGTINLKSQNAKIIADTIFQAMANEMRANGIESSDHPSLRLISRTLANDGLTGKDVQDNIQQWIQKAKNAPYDDQPALIKWLNDNKPSNWLK